MITLTQGSTSYSFRIATWLGADATRIYTRALPLAQAESIIGEEEFRQPAIPDILTWSVDSWAGGEGETVWRESQPDIYNLSFNVRPVTTGDGLELGAEQQASLNDVSAAIHDEGARLGIGLGSLWSASDTSAHPWLPASEAWDETVITTGHGANAIVNFADPGDTWIYTGSDDSAIRRWKTGSNEAYYGTGTFTYDPVLMAFQGTLYALDGDDLYKITAADTRTQVSDTSIASASSAVYLGTSIAAHFRMSKSDVGPIWLQRMDNGQTYIHEYNHYLDTTETRAQLPDFVTPYDINFFNGFTFTAFRYAGTHATAGDAYLYYERGGQRGFAGPIRSQTGTTASKPVRIAGMTGSDIIIYFDGALWAYDLSSGGISMVTDLIQTGTLPTQARIFGKDVFIGDTTSGANTDSVERVSLDSYTTQTAAYLSSGTIDFRLPGVEKVLLEIIVVTDPLPANTTLQVAYAADGASFTTHATTSSTDNDTKHTFTVSNSTTSVTGQVFEVRVMPTTTSTAATPTIRNVTATAAVTAKRWFYDFLLDLGDTGTEYGLPQEAAQVIADLKALEATGGVWTLSNPYDVREHDSASSTDILVRDVDSALERLEGGFVGRIRMASVSTV